MFTFKINEKKTCLNLKSYKFTLQKKINKLFRKCNLCNERSQAAAASIEFMINKMICFFLARFFTLMVDVRLTE